MQASFFSDSILHKPELFRAILAFNGLIPSEGGRPSSLGAEEARFSVDTGEILETEPSDGERAEENSTHLDKLPEADDCSGEPDGATGNRPEGTLPFAEWGSISGLDLSLLMNSRRFRRHFSHDTQPAYWDFGEETRRIALLPPQAVERLALTFGAAIHGVELARLILREDVVAMRTELGSSLYLYAIQRGRFQLGNVRQFFLVRDMQESLSGKIRKHGQQAVAWCLAGWPEELRLRCPHVPVAEGVPESLTPTLRRALWFGLKKLLVKEVAPQWAPCFD